MCTGTNSSGPSGLIRRALRIGLLAGLTVGFTLAPGVMRADGQVRGRGGHFGGGFGGWHLREGAYNFNRGRGGPGGWQNHGQANRRGGYYAHRQVRQGQMNRGANGPRQMRPAYAGQNNANRSAPTIGPRQSGFQNTRPGQQHLPQWWAAHRGLSPDQQAEAMRREPGFQSLPQGQQQRLLNRLRNFDSRPPQVQQRMLDRVEMFERLSPERQQEVRGASAAFNRMPQPQKQRMIQAFQQLRHMPPAERQQMLHSAYGQQFTPQERTVLGNLLSVEPYQPSNAEPYFGRAH
ncbi:MAG TPA: DUF3106 domain-containing protein [Acidobacteriaceae bacterium]|nr:DUF3106 domain-containing protein [Acidobacteriaceae bacterium]